MDGDARPDRETTGYFREGIAVDVWWSSLAATVWLGVVALVVAIMVAGSAAGLTAGPFG